MQISVISKKFGDSPFTQDRLPSALEYGRGGAGTCRGSSQMHRPGYPVCAPPCCICAPHLRVPAPPRCICAPPLHVSAPPLRVPAPPLLFFALRLSPIPAPGALF